MIDKDSVFDLEKYKAEKLADIEKSTKSKYVNADKFVEAYKHLRGSLCEILDVHALHDGYYHLGNASGPIVCSFDDIDEYIIEEVRKLGKE